MVLLLLLLLLVLLLLLLCFRSFLIDDVIRLWVGKVNCTASAVVHHVVFIVFPVVFVV